jgi:hypothetical protein
VTTTRATIATALATILVAATATAATAPAAASAAPPPKELTHKYPLGTQTLCCQSHPSTTSAASSAPAGAAPGTPKPTQHTPATPTHNHGGGLGPTLLVVVAAIVLAIVLLDGLAIRRARRAAPRPRREVPRIVLLLLRPFYRYDGRREAWIVRVVGERRGPVLRPRGYRVTHLEVEDPWLTDDAPLEAEPPPLAIRPRRR